MGNCIANGLNRGFNLIDAILHNKIQYVWQHHMYYERWCANDAGLPLFFTGELQMLWFCAKLCANSRIL